MKTSVDFINAFKQLSVIEQIKVANMVNQLLMDYMLAVAELKTIKEENATSNKEQSQNISWLDELHVSNAIPPANTTFDRNFLYQDIPSL